MTEPSTYIPITFGTYRIPKEKTDELVTFAIESGCRHIDTAQLYKNEEEVWSAVNEWNRKASDVTSLLNKHHVSVTTKIHKKLIIDSHRDNRSIETSIIGNPALILLHSPEKNFHIAWEQLKRIAYSPSIDLDSDKNHHPLIGVSNFTILDMEQLSSKPAVNQIEVTPFNDCKTTVDYCTRHGICVQAHSALTKGELLNTPEICQYATTYSLTAPQLMIAWSITNSFVPIFSSKSTQHIKEILSTPRMHVILPNLHIAYRTHPQYQV
jgi:diketogulonate reductase-like aldo/keto reductase